MRSTRRCLAGFLAAVASFGLVVAPVLHAQLHASDAEQEYQHALDEVFDVAFARDRGATWSAALAQALQRAFGGSGPRGLSEIDHEHHHPDDRHSHGHSHGPGNHGAGSLAHFALAVHAAPALPEVTAPERVADSPVRAPVVVHLTPQYLVPKFSQGPPRT